MNVKSISIMGKAGILEGGKGDIMIPDAHLFEGTADNYPFENQLKKSDLEGQGINVVDGAIITVLGTSLQNKDILRFFHDSTCMFYSSVLKICSRILSVIRYVGLTPEVPSPPEANVLPVSSGLSEA